MAEYIIRIYEIDYSFPVEGYGKLYKLVAYVNDNRFYYPLDTNRYSDINGPYIVGNRLYYDEEII